MLAGEAVVAIWNGITPEGRDEFYAWHLHEHMPERAGIPGFRRGRRYIATSERTTPEFFTLYEAETLQVLQGSDYHNRLNAPSTWTRAATRHFRDTARALARIIVSAGPGSGGIMLTLRFVGSPETLDAVAVLVRSAATMPRVTGAHLCAGDAVASSTPTSESAGRSDILAPPDTFALIEATDEQALLGLLSEKEMEQVGAQQVVRGIYRLEYSRRKTAWA